MMLNLCSMISDETNSRHKVKSRQLLSESNRDDMK